MNECTAGRNYRLPAREISGFSRRKRSRECIDPAHMNRCGFCGSNRNKRVHHINGREWDITPANLMCACHACNLKVAAVMRSRGLGAPAEPNPETAGARNLAQWMIAVKSMRGESDQMSPRAAIAMIRATSPTRRSRFAEDIWKIRRAKGTDTPSTGFKFGANQARESGH